MHRHLATLQAFLFTNRISQQAYNHNIIIKCEPKHTQTTINCVCLKIIDQYCGTCTLYVASYYFDVGSYRQPYGQTSASETLIVENNTHSLLLNECLRSPPMWTGSRRWNTDAKLALDLREMRRREIFLHIIIIYTHEIRKCSACSSAVANRHEIACVCVCLHTLL